MNTYVGKKSTSYYRAQNLFCFIYKQEAFLYVFNKHWFIQEGNFHVN